MLEIFTDEQVSVAQQNLNQLVADGFSVAQQPTTVTRPAIDAALFNAWRRGTPTAATFSHRHQQSWSFAENLRAQLEERVQQAALTSEESNRAAQESHEGQSSQAREPAIELSVEADSQVSPDPSTTAAFAELRDLEAEGFKVTY